MLVIGHQWPEPDATAAGERMLWLLKGFLSDGYSVTFACACGPGAYEADLEGLGIQRVAIRLNDSSFDHFLKSRRFSHVLFDRFLTEEQFSWRVRQCLPQALLLLDTEDLHSLRHSREVAVRQGKSWSISDWSADPVFFREVASMFRADLNLIISEREIHLLTTLLPLLKAKLVYVPFGMDLPDPGERMDFYGRSGFVFVGNGKHRPNLDAITQLKTAIWPQIRKSLPGERLCIYGAYLPEHMMQFHAPADGFEVIGWAPDLGAVFRKARLQLAPLRYGAGIKGKVLKANLFGLPTLGTSSGFEGIIQVSDALSFSADTADSFAAKAVDLYKDEPTWSSALHCQNEAVQAHVRASFDLLAQTLQSLQQRKAEMPNEARILENLLRNEAFGRVQYLSRWIEAKEKGEN